MKNLVLSIGGVLIILNSLVGFTFPAYLPFNMMFGNVSIALTTALIYVSNKLQTADGFKIGYILLLGVSGSIRFVCGVLSSDKLENNAPFILFVGIFCFECLLILLSHVMRNK